VQLLLESMRVVQHRLEGTFGCGRTWPQPRDHLPLLEPVTPRRILRTTDMLDHGLVAEAENLALTTLG
jgi:hypothetical protein